MATEEKAAPICEAASGSNGVILSISAPIFWDSDSISNRFCRLIQRSGLVLKNHPSRSADTFPCRLDTMFTAALHDVAERPALISRQP